MSDILDRLRGKYPVGPIRPSGEPEFGWREFYGPERPMPAINAEAAAEIASLRDRLAKAEAALALAVATIAGYERHSYGWPKDDTENTYADANTYVEDGRLYHGAIIEWEVAAVIRTERYRVVEHRDEEGNWTHTTAELVTDADNPLPEAPRA